VGREEAAHVLSPLVGKRKETEKGWGSTRNAPKNREAAMIKKREREYFHVLQRLHEAFDAMLYLTASAPSEGIKSEGGNERGKAKVAGPAGSADAYGGDKREEIKKEGRLIPLGKRGLIVSGRCFFTSVNTAGREGTKVGCGGGGGGGVGGGWVFVGCS